MTKNEIMKIYSIFTLLIFTFLMSCSDHQTKTLKVKNEEKPTVVISDKKPEKHNVTESEKAKQALFIFLEAYKKSNYDQFFNYPKELITNVAFVKNDTTKYYRVDFKNAEEYIKILKDTQYFSENYLNHLRKEFQDDDLAMQKYPSNDGPPEGFDYDWILLTQESEINLAKTKVISEKKISATAQEIVLQFQYGNTLQFLMKKETDVWKIDEIKNPSN